MSNAALHYIVHISDALTALYGITGLGGASLDDMIMNSIGMSVQPGGAPADTLLPQGVSCGYLMLRYSIRHAKVCQHSTTLQAIVACLGLSMEVQHAPR